MAIVFESYSVDYCADTSDTTLSPAVPSGTQDGDLLIAIVVHSYTKTITPPSGWTSVFEYSNSTAAAAVSVFYKIASSESGTYSFALGSTYGYAQTVVCRISGASTDAPTGSAQGDGTWDNTIVCPDQEVTVADSMLLWIGALGGTLNYTFTSNRGDEEYDGYHSTAYTLSIYSELISGTGTQTGATITPSSAVNKKTGGGIVITPATTTGPNLAAAAYYYQRLIAG